MGSNTARCQRRACDWASLSLHGYNLQIQGIGALDPVVSVSGYSVMWFPDLFSVIFV